MWTPADLPSAKHETQQHSH
uniref:Uncharacterized protein n=1 Tax=Arundo donax TaxID=35708 RepID=A0A0A8ZAZ0_ARUDO